MFFDLRQYSWHSYKKELSALTTLTLPMLLAQIAQVGTGFVDTIMAGGAGKEHLAAVALGSSLFFTIYVTLMGVMTAVNPMLAQLYGANHTTQIGVLGRQGIWFGLFCGLVGMGLVWLAIAPFQAWLDVSQTTLGITAEYLWFIGLAMPAAMVHRALHAYASSLNRPRTIMWVSWLCFFLNIPLNYIFVYGKFGMPALGGAGCGLATAVVFWVNAIVLWIYIAKDRYFAPFGLMQRFDLPDLRQFAAMLKLGVPIGFSFFLEVSLFTCIMFLLAKLDGNSEDFVAAQQIVMSLTSLIFMIPSSLGNASTVRVGQALGANQPAQARYNAGVALSLSMVLSVVTAIGLIVLRTPVARMYTDDVAVLDIATTLLLFSAAFQLVDAVQCVSSCALRGYKVSTMPMIIHIISFWGCGLIPGYYLAFHQQMGIYGFWTALVISLGVAAVWLTWYLEIHSKKILLAIK